MPACQNEDSLSSTATLASHFLLLESTLGAATRVGHSLGILCTFSSLQKACCNLSECECHCWKENLSFSKVNYSQVLQLKLWDLLPTDRHSRPLWGGTHAVASALTGNKQGVLLGRMNKQGFS